MSDGKTAPRHSERVADCIDGIMARKDGSMTDSKTATERLREMLDERGVKWDGESYTDVTFWNEETNLAVASDDHDGKLWVSMRLTPEQTIAATLGSDETKGLRAKVKAQSDYIDHLRGEYKALDSMHERSCAKYLRDIRELHEKLEAATLGSGECEAIHDTDYHRGINGICEGLYCSKCGEPLSSKFGYCPWCGAKVIS